MTEAGEQFFQACLAVQDDFDQATIALQQQHMDVSGRLSVTAPLTLGSVVIGPLLAKFMRNYPKINITLDLSDHVKGLSSADFDVAIRAAQRLPDSDLKAKKLYQYDYQITASPDYLKKFGAPITPQDLVHHKVVTCVTGKEGDDQSCWSFQVGDELISVPVESIARVTHMQVQKAIALEGLALIRTPAYWVCEEIESGCLVPVLARFNKSQSNIFALYKNSANVPVKIKALIAYLAEHLPLSFS